jgi:hypothetical protein
MKHYNEIKWNNKEDVSISTRERKRKIERDLENFSLIIPYKDWWNSLTTEQKSSVQRNFYKEEISRKGGFKEWLDRISKEIINKKAQRNLRIDKIRNNEE